MPPAKAASEKNAHPRDPRPRHAQQQRKTSKTIQPTSTTCSPWSAPPSPTPTHTRTHARTHARATTKRTPRLTPHPTHHHHRHPFGPCDAHHRCAQTPHSPPPPPHPHTTILVSHKHPPHARNTCTPHHTRPTTATANGNSATDKCTWSSPHGCDNANRPEHTICPRRADSTHAPTNRNNTHSASCCSLRRCSCTLAVRRARRAPVGAARKLHSRG